MTYKISPDMIAGAKRLPPYRIGFFGSRHNANGNTVIESACAMGCLIYEQNRDKSDVDLLNYNTAMLDEETTAVLKKDIKIEEIPAHIRFYSSVLFQDELGKRLYGGIITFSSLIGLVNDHISRSAAIEMVEEMGY
jgi:hypothetical protein